jgi:SAM-dependent methyltransferase
MRQNILDYIECAKCGSGYNILPFEQMNGHIMDGLLRCSNCNNIVFVILGIPRFVSSKIVGFDSDFQNFAKKYKENIKDISNACNRLDATSTKTDSLRNIKRATSKYFGFEWEYFNEWGWISDDSVSEEQKEYEYYGGVVSHTERAFKIKCMLDAGDLAPGKLVLDAGCGNGRYTYHAAKNGAEVVGVDIGYGVKSAFKHMKDLQNVHIIQGDLFDLPFKSGIFDSVFSNGVLMHTGDAKKAFFSITKHIKKNGVFVAHLYHKRNLIFEIVDHTLRFFTSKLSIDQNMKFAKFMARWGRKLKQKGAWNKWFRFIEVLPTTIHMYDWYSAQIATHHTYPEVKGWFKDTGFDIIKTNEPPGDQVTFLNKPESLTVKGRKN